MPLDLQKIIIQLNNLGHEEARDLNKLRVDSTYKLFQLACDNKEKAVNRLIETDNTKKANFFFGIPALNYNEGLSFDKTVPGNNDFSLPHITAATDGSQINPSAHQFSNAFLINIGLVSIPYFAHNVPVLLSSEPTVYNFVEELLPSNTMGNILEEDLVSYERTLKEIEELVKLAKNYASHKLPVVALLDGTLIHWHLEKFDKFFVELFMKRFSDAIFELKSLRIPIASVLSNSRSNDLINMLKIFKCPYDSVDCKKYCSNIDSKNLPCNPCQNYKPVFDRKLIDKYFLDQHADFGSRTVLFKSNNKVLNYYSEDLKVFFFYINTGTEIARVEIPGYVAQDSNMLGLLHNAIALQFKVGFGYPVVLSEAHHLAVVNKKDREVFYELVKDQLLKKTKTELKISSKELRKRISYV